MEQIQQWPQSKGWERSVHGALMKSLMERRLEHLPSTDAWDLHLSEHNNYINNWYSSNSPPKVLIKTVPELAGGGSTLLFYFSHVLVLLCKVSHPSRMSHPELHSDTSQGWAPTPHSANPESAVVLLRCFLSQPLFHLSCLFPWQPLLLQPCGCCPILPSALACSIPREQCRSLCQDYCELVCSNTERLLGSVLKASLNPLGIQFLSSFCLWSQPVVLPRAVVCAGCAAFQAQSECSCAQAPVQMCCSPRAGLGMRSQGLWFHSSEASSWAFMLRNCCLGMLHSLHSNLWCGMIKTLFRFLMPGA